MYVLYFDTPMRYYRQFYRAPFQAKKTCVYTVYIIIYIEPRKLIYIVPSRVRVLYMLYPVPRLQASPG